MFSFNTNNSTLAALGQDLIHELLLVRFHVHAQIRQLLEPVVRRVVQRVIPRAEAERHQMIHRNRGRAVEVVHNIQIGLGRRVAHGIRNQDLEASPEVSVEVHHKSQNHAVEVFHSIRNLIQMLVLRNANVRS